MPQEEDRCVAAVKARLEEYGIGPHPGFDRDDLMRRKRIALGVLATVMLTMAIAHLWSGQPVPAVLARIVFVGIELPLLFFFVAKAYDYVLRRRLGPLQSLLVSMAASVSVATVTLSIFWLFARYSPAVAASFPGELKNSYLAVLLCGITVGIVHLGVFALAFVYPFAAHDARVRALEAEKLRTAAELARLRGHLEPHFILNTLNAIAGLVTEDPREARRLIAALGDLLRDALRDGDEVQTLEQEEAWLRRYAEILESRHKGALGFRWQIDPSVRSVPVPRLLLQPLVENAVKHGALRRRGGGVVTIRAERPEDRPDVVACTIEDDGPGFADGPIRQGAVGLSVVRRRLQLKFERADFRIESSTEGTRAIIELAAPRPEPAAAVQAPAVPKRATA